MAWLRESSPSFLIAVALVVLTVTGYVAWRVFRPNQVKQSDRIARGFARDAARLVGAYRRSLLDVTRTSGGHPADTAKAEAEIEGRTEETLRTLRKSADAAQARLDEMEGISLRTLRNRLDRIRTRLEEATTMVHEEEARARLALRPTPVQRAATPAAAG